MRRAVEEALIAVSALADRNWVVMSTTKSMNSRGSNAFMLFV